MQVTCSCWCEADEVLVPVEDIKKGVTGSCTRPGCEPGCDPAPETDDYSDLQDPNDPGFTTEADPDQDATDAPWTPRRKKMNRFKTASYSPRADESPELPKSLTGIDPANLHLITRHENGEELCACGCGATKGAKSKFAMGHDIRLRGKLTRLASAGGRVRLVVATDTGWILEDDSIDPYVYATRFSTPKLDWAVSISESVTRVRIRESKSKGAVAAAEKAVLAKATGPKVGDTTLIKVGRWDKTGRIAAVYQVDGTDVMEVEYVDAKGGTHTARRTGDGAWKTVA